MGSLLQGLPKSRERDLPKSMERDLPKSMPCRPPSPPPGGSVPTFLSEKLHFKGSARVRDPQRRQNRRFCSESTARKEQTPFSAARAKHFQLPFCGTTPRGGATKGQLKVLCPCSGKGGLLFSGSRFGTKSAILPPLGVPDPCRPLEMQLFTQKCWNGSSRRWGGGAAGHTFRQVTLHTFRQVTLPTFRQALKKRTQAVTSVQSRCTGILLGRSRSLLSGRSRSILLGRSRSLLVGRSRSILLGRSRSRLLGRSRSILGEYLRFHVSHWRPPAPH